MRHPRHDLPIATCYREHDTRTVDVGAHAAALEAHEVGNALAGDGACQCNKHLSLPCCIKSLQRGGGEVGKEGGREGEKEGGRKEGRKGGRERERKVGQEGGQEGGQEVGWVGEGARAEN